MGTAQLQGALWGAGAHDYAEFVEALFTPVYDAVLTETGVGPGTRLLDVGCGPGLAAQMAARRGALVAGIDAAESSLAIARLRTPGGDFRAGDMEELPFADGLFDVVTGFNAFPFAADPVAALHQARRVTRPGGRVAVVVWGDLAVCETAAIVAAVLGQLMPAPPPAGGPDAFATIDAIGRTLTGAGLSPLSGGEVKCVFSFPNQEAAVCGMLSAGPLVAAGRRVGREAVAARLTEALQGSRTAAGGYCQRNTFRYVIAAA